MIRFEQLTWTDATGWREVRSSPGRLPEECLVLLFGGRGAISAPLPVAALRARFPAATLVGCSTAGEMLDTEVSDEGLVATVLSFESTRVVLAAECAATPDSSADVQTGSGIAWKISLTSRSHRSVSR